MNKLGRPLFSGRNYENNAHFTIFHQRLRDDVWNDTSGSIHYDAIQEFGLVVMTVGNLTYRGDKMRRAPVQRYVRYDE